MKTNTLSPQALALLGIYDTLTVTGLSEARAEMTNKIHELRVQVARTK